MKSTELKRRAIEFFKKETKIDQLTSPISVESIKLMILFSESENAKLKEIIKQKDLGIDKLISSCTEVNLCVSKLIEDYALLMQRYKESQCLLKQDFKKDINPKLN